MKRKNIQDIDPTRRALFERGGNRVFIETVQLLGGDNVVMAMVHCHGQYASHGFDLMLGKRSRDMDVDAAFCDALRRYAGVMDEYKIARLLIHNDAKWVEDLRETMDYARDAMDGLNAIAGLCDESGAELRRLTK